MKRYIAYIVTSIVLLFAVCAHSDTSRYKYYVDPNAADQGAATTRGTQSIKDLITLIGTSKKATLVMPHALSGVTTAYTVTTALDLTTYPNINFEVENGAQFSGSGNITMYHSSNINAGELQTIWGGDNLVKFAKISKQTVENFGATGDGTTNDYPMFLKGLKAGCTRSGGIRLVWSPDKIYVLNAGTSPAISLNADSLPDGTDSSGWGDNELPVFHLGPETPTYFRGVGASTPAKYLSITGTGDGINITSSGTRTWRGKLTLENFAMHGNGTADDGLYLNYANRSNIFRNLLIYGFAGDGVEMGGNSVFSIVWDNVYSHYNQGWGWKVYGNAMSFPNCIADRNGGGGVQIINGVNIEWPPSSGSQFNKIPQFQVLSCSGLKLQSYVEGQSATMNGTEAAGAGAGIFDLDGNSGANTLSGIEITGYIKTGAPTDDTKKEQYVVKFGTSIAGLNFHTARLGSFANTGFSSYIFSPIGEANALQNVNFKSLSYASGSFTSEFADAQTASKFVGRTYVVPFGGTDLADNTATLLSMGSRSTVTGFVVPDTGALLGWTYGISGVLNTGTVTVAISGVSPVMTQELTITGETKSGSYSYNPGNYYFTAGDTIMVTATTATMGVATTDIDVIPVFSAVPERTWQ